MKKYLSFLLLFACQFYAFSQTVQTLDVTWLSPNPIRFDSGIVISEASNLKLEFIIKTTQNEAVIRENLRILINGVDSSIGKKTLGKVEIKKKETECFMSQTVQLNEGKNIIELALEISNQPKQISKKLIVNYQSFEKPNLYLVCVGVSSNLKFAKKDAESMFNIFKGQLSTIFESVRGELLVCEANTTKVMIATTIENIKYQGLRPQDVVILFFSGHGLNSLNESNDFYLETSDAYIASVSKYSLLSYQKDIIDNIKDLQCKRIILIDACHSGAAKQEGNKSANTDYKNIQKVISQTPPSIITLASSSENEVSYEDASWQHGAFTKAIIEGLNSKADSKKDNIIWVTEIVDYVIENVPKITSSKPVPQHPQLVTEILNDFPIFDCTQQNKSYKPLELDCKPINITSEAESNAIFFVAITDDKKNIDWNLAEKIAAQMKDILPKTTIRKVTDEIVVKNGVIAGLNDGNVKLAEKLPQNLGTQFYIVTKKTILAAKPIVGQIIWEARTYIHFTKIDIKTGQKLDSFEADESPSPKSDPNKQQAEELSIKLTLSQLSADKFR